MEERVRNRKRDFRNSNLITTFRWKTLIKRNAFYSQFFSAQKLNKKWRPSSWPCSLWVLWSSAAFLQGLQQVEAIDILISKPLIGLAHPSLLTVIVIVIVMSPATIKQALVLYVGPVSWLIYPWIQCHCSYSSRPANYGQWASYFS